MRDWCLRSTVIFEGTPHERASEAEVSRQRETCEIVLEAALSARTSTPDESVAGKTLTDADGALPPPEERTPRDGARARLNLLAAAAQRDDTTGLAADIAPAPLESRATEPIDANLFENEIRRLSRYGHSLARQGVYDEAIEVFDGLAAMYPDSLLGDKWQGSADHLRRVTERPSKRGM